VPADHANMVCVVVVDEPMANGYYGGVVAAPVFKNVMEYALKRDKALLPAQCYNPKPDKAKQAGPKEVVARAGDSEETDEETPAKPAGAVYPSVIGLTLKEAAEVLARSGITWRASGSGVVLSQEPAASSLLDGRKLCSLVLGVSE
jgi:cell division protein FtsI (penicillin-binding protein 3)